MTYDFRQDPPADWRAGLSRRFPTEPFVELALDRKLDNRARTIAPISPDVRHQQLTEFLARRIDGPFEVSDLRPLTGGVSKEQFWFELTTHDSGRTNTEKLVLRLQPPQSSAETHRLREFQLINALQGILPVPRGLWEDAEGRELSEPGIICSWCDGVAKAAGGGGSGVRTSYPRELRARIAEQFIDNLAKLARFDWRAHPLSAFQPFHDRSTEGVIAFINWWRRVWEEDGRSPIAALTLAEDWLRRNAPEIDKVSVVHGDYRASNFLFDPADGRLTAVLDWELAFLGDRHADLAYVILPHRLEKDEDGRPLVQGLCSRDYFLAEYEKRSGLPVDPVRLRYYEVLLRWRAAIIGCGTGVRCLIGQKSHQDVVVGWHAGLIAPITLQALHDVLSATPSLGAV